MPGNAGERDGDAERPGLWCRRCDEPGERRDGKFVHTATGAARGEDGHQAYPTVTDPEHKAEARAIAEEFGGRWLVHAHLTGFYAVPAGVLMPASVSAATGAEMREKIAAQERIWSLQARRPVLP